MANQYTTGQGQGFPEDEDPMKRMLASGVNDQQGLQNMDPGKVGNPYVGGGNPYGTAVGGAQRAIRQAGGGNPYGSAGGAGGAGGGAGGGGAVGATQPQQVVRRQAQAAVMPQAMPAGMSASPTGTYQQNFDAIGEGLRRAATGERTGDQLAAERIAAENVLYGGGMSAADRSGAAVGSGDSGFSRRALLGLAGQAEAGRAQVRAADTAAARQALLGWTGQREARETAAEQRQLAREGLAQEQGQFEAGQAQEQRQFEAEQLRRQREAEAERSFKRKQGLIDTALKGLGVVFNPVGSAIGEAGAGLFTSKRSSK